MQTAGWNCDGFGRIFAFTFPNAGSVPQCGTAYNLNGLKLQTSPGVASASARAGFGVPTHSKIVPLSQAPYLVLGFDRLGLTRTGHGLSSAQVANRRSPETFFNFYGRSYSDVPGEARGTGSNPHF